MDIKKNAIYSWDDVEHIAICILKYKNNEFTGIAQCAPDDLDMCNEFTGQVIAEMRALIKVLQFQKNNEIYPELRALNRLYYTMKHSTQFNPDSYEAHTLMRQIKALEKELVDIKYLIKTNKDILYNYINEKDNFYKQVRKARARHD